VCRIRVQSMAWLIVAIVNLSGFSACPSPQAASLAYRGPGKTARATQPLAQLVHTPGPVDDDEAPDGRILRVSRVADGSGRAIEDTGRSVASVQFMITRAMREELVALGFSSAQVDAMEPSRAGAILAKRTPSKQAQRKPKRKQSRFELQFTCNQCGCRNSHSISHHAYTRGTVIVTCPGCQSSHLIADHLNYIENDFQTLETYMQQRGSPVTRLVTDGRAAAAVTEDAAAEVGARDGDGKEQVVAPLDGISPEQARRIREAVRGRKRRRQCEDGAGDAGGR